MTVRGQDHRATEPRRDGTAPVAAPTGASPDRAPLDSEDWELESSQQRSPAPATGSDAAPAAKAGRAHAEVLTIPPEWFAWQPARREPTTEPARPADAEPLATGALGVADTERPPEPDGDFPASFSPPPPSATPRIPDASGADRDDGAPIVLGQLRHVVLSLGQDESDPELRALRARETVPQPEAEPSSGEVAAAVSAPRPSYPSSRSSLALAAAALTPPSTPWHGLGWTLAVVSGTCAGAVVAVLFWTQQLRPPLPSRWGDGADAPGPTAVVTAPSTVGAAAGEPVASGVAAPSPIGTERGAAEPRRAGATMSAPVAVAATTSTVEPGLAGASASLAAAPSVAPSARNAPRADAATPPSSARRTDVPSAASPSAPLRLVRPKGVRRTGSPLAREGSP